MKPCTGGNAWAGVLKDWWHSPCELNGENYPSCRGIRRRYLTLKKKNLKILTWNRLDLEILGCSPIMLKHTVLGIEVKHWVWAKYVHGLRKYLASICIMVLCRIVDCRPSIVAIDGKKGR